MSKSIQEANEGYAVIIWVVTYNFLLSKVVLYSIASKIPSSVILICSYCFRLPIMLFYVLCIICALSWIAIVLSSVTIVNKLYLNLTWSVDNNTIFYIYYAYCLQFTVFMYVVINFIMLTLISNFGTKLRKCNYIMK